MDGHPKPIKLETKHGKHQILGKQQITKNKIQTNSKLQYPNLKKWQKHS
jgi:hypothetical protein